MYDDMYTGREIAIFSDIYGLFEPLEAILYDMRKRGIYEIYSLGDNVGLGPDSPLVIDMLEYYNVRSVCGDREDYCILGIEPFLLYFDNYMIKSQEWLMSNLDNNRLNYIRTFSHSIDINVGGKNIGLCHFANDVRCDFTMNSYLNYLNNIDNGDAYKQFLYTNSDAQREQIKYNLERFGFDSLKMKGFLSVYNNPLFGGKRVDYYDAIIQGHVHTGLYECGGNTDFYTITSLMGQDSLNIVSYIILKEKLNMGFDIEKVFVEFDRNRMEKSILSSNEPTGMIKKLVKMR